MSTRNPVRSGLILALILIGAVPAKALTVRDYDFPIADPLAATVAGTPPEVRAALPELVRGKNTFRDTVRLLPQRPVPPVFWYYADGLDYRVVYQEGPAPLVVLIPGTGSSAHSSTALTLARALYKGGLHVLILPSPTTPNFQVTASETGVPGRLDEDARDLYRALRVIREHLRDRLQVTGFYIAGFSQGAVNAAFVAALDERERAFGFQKLLLLNPPVNLFDSAQILDDMLERHVQGDPVRMRQLIQRVFDDAAALYSGQAEIDLTGDFLFYAYEALRPDRALLEALVGFVFRFSTNNLAFTADVLTHWGYVVPKDAVLTPRTSLTDVFIEGNYLTFGDFFEGLYLPYFRARAPSYTHARAIAEESLKSLDGYLRHDSKAGLITNADDITLAPGDLDYLKALFGDRAVIFPRGGHGGNYAERRFVATLIDFFRR